MSESCSHLIPVRLELSTAGPLDVTFSQLEEKCYESEGAAECCNDVKKHQCDENIIPNHSIPFLCRKFKKFSKLKLNPTSRKSNHLFIRIVSTLVSDEAGVLCYGVYRTFQLSKGVGLVNSLTTLSHSAEDTDSIVAKVASEILSSSDLRSFMQIYRGRPKSFQTNEGEFSSEIITNASLLYRHGLPIYTRKTGVSLRGFSLVGLQIASIASGLWIQKISKEFQDLSPKMIGHCFREFNKSSSVFDFVLYTLALHDSKIQLPAMAGTTKEQSAEFVKKLNRELIHRSDSQQFDTSEPSEEFCNRVVMSENPPYGELNYSRESQITALFILRALYSEKRMIEIFNTHPTGIRNPRQLLTLIKDWDNLKTYPLEWILDVI